MVGRPERAAPRAVAMGERLMSSSCIDALVSRIALQRISKTIAIKKARRMSKIGSRAQTRINIEKTLMYRKMKISVR